MIRRWAFVLFFCILIPSCIKRTDVGKLINKSLGDVELRLHSEAAGGEGRGGEGDVLLDHTQSASQYSMLIILVCVCPDTRQGDLSPISC